MSRANIYGHEVCDASNRVRILFTYNYQSAPVIIICVKGIQVV